MRPRIPAAPVLEPHATVEWIRRLRATDAPTVALATGEFEILQAAHVRYLQAAARHADVLIVGVRDDAAVTARRAERRPLLAAADRAAMVAGLSCVDAVVIFAVDADELAVLLRPDVLVRRERASETTVSAAPGTAAGRGTRAGDEAPPWREIVIPEAESAAVDLVSRIGEIDP